MLPNHIVAEVEQMLSTKAISQREIARRTGVSRGSVAAIANGTRRVNAQRDIHFFPEPTDRTKLRCDGCGHKVIQPCLICAARDHKHQRQRQKLRPMTRSHDRRQAAGTTTSTGCCPRG